MPIALVLIAWLIGLSLLYLLWPLEWTTPRYERIEMLLRLWFRSGPPKGG